MIPKRLLLLGIFAAYVGYVVYTIPIPEGISEPHTLRYALAKNVLAYRLINFLDFIGILKDYRAIRWLRKQQGMDTLDGVSTKDTVIAGVPVRVYTPDGLPRHSKAMVFYHGGGWVLGSIDTHHGITGYFAKESKMIVVSVEYRLSPEHSKNDGLDDCLAVTKKFLKNAANFGVDPDRVVIAGDSAGGNYAAGVALRLRDDSFDPMPKIQLLIYPSVQGIDIQMPSYQQNPEGPVLSNFLINWFQSYTTTKSKSYMSYFRTNTHVPSDVRVAMAKGVLNHDRLPNQYKYPPYTKPNYERGGDSEIWHRISNDFLDPYYFPLMADDLSDLPIAYVMTAQFDPLRDEGYLYAERMRLDGVEVTYYNCRNGWHGMVNAVNKLSEATDVMRKMADFLNKNL